MFEYSDPTGSGFLESAGALAPYRAMVDPHYDRAAREPRSAFSWLEAFGQLPEGVKPRRAVVSWRAFPLTAAAPNGAIDNNRFRFQDEYVEWRVTRTENGDVQDVVFTTEFSEYYEALAFVGADKLLEEIRRLIPDANPTPQDLFGMPRPPGAGRGRAEAFRSHRERNPWNNGEKGILCLTVSVNSMLALFELMEECAKPRLDIPSASVCATTACVPDRASDPSVCIAAQDAARAGQIVSLADPVGIEILDLNGIWTLDGKEIQVNDPASNRGVWEVLRNRRRGILHVTPRLRLDGEPIRTGAQVAAALRVGAAVLALPSNLAPPWALTGNESQGRRGPHA
jgi:hypothetical protein